MARGAEGPPRPQIGGSAHPRPARSDPGFRGECFPPDRLERRLDRVHRRRDRATPPSRARRAIGGALEPTQAGPPQRIGSRSLLRPGARGPRQLPSLRKSGSVRPTPGRSRVDPATPARPARPPRRRRRSGPGDPASYRHRSPGRRGSSSQWDHRTAAGPSPGFRTRLRSPSVRDSRPTGPCSTVRSGLASSGGETHLTPPLGVTSSQFCRVYKNSINLS